MATTYRYYLPTFVGASAGVSPRRRRITCVDCRDDIAAGRRETEDRCRRYTGTTDSNGYLYCTDCGHGEHVHP